MPGYFFACGAICGAVLFGIVLRMVQNEKYLTILPGPYHLEPHAGKSMGEVLQTIVGQMPVREIGADHYFFGNLTVTFDKPEDEGGNIAAVPLLIHAA